ncbi:hypothetical protein Tco_0009499 [Tanacetum coccineum]
MMSDHNSSDLAPQRQEMSVENVTSDLVPQGKKASDYDNSDPLPKTKCCSYSREDRFVTSRSLDMPDALSIGKSTSGGIQFLGDKLVSWMSKKQNCTAMSSAEAEYVALSASCAQVMWMRTTSRLWLQLHIYRFCPVD